MTTDYKGPPVIPVRTVLVLRTCASNLSSQRGFIWPGVGGEAIAADWDPTPECGHGLHGWLHGQGDYSASSYLDATAKWLVVEVAAHTIVQLGGKVKFPRGVVRFVGDKKSATDYLLANDQAARDVAVIGAHIQVGDEQVAKVGALGVASSGTRGTSTSGYGGTSTSGDSGTSTSGNGGTSTSGDSGTSTSGDSGTSTSGYGGTSTSGYGGTSTSGTRGTSTSGTRGTSTSGYGGTSTSGDSGTSTSGYGGTSTSGDSGTSTSGDSGTSTSGYKGEIRIRYYDRGADRYRTKIGYVGEDGIKPNTPYKLDDNLKFVEVKKP